MQMSALSPFQQQAGLYAPSFGRNVRFGEDHKKTDPAVTPAEQQPGRERQQKPGFFQKSCEVAHVIARKVSNKQEFKHSVQHGVEKSKESLNKDFKSGSTIQIAKRVGIETLGVAVMIVFLPMPGPNPGLFISPTVRSFLKGFIKAPAVTPETPPAAEPPPDESNKKDKPDV